MHPRVYNLACLGGSISCSRDIFERFWKDRLHESVDDRQTVATWRRLLASAADRAPEMAPSPLLRWEEIPDVCPEDQDASSDGSTDDERLVHTPGPIAVGYDRVCPTDSRTG